jgi:hypothetical protein
LEFLEVPYNIYYQLNVIRPQLVGELGDDEKYNSPPSAPFLGTQMTQLEQDLRR